MTETPTDPAATLWRAAELAPKVLPPEIGALVAQKITLALESPMRVADLHPFYGRLAAEVLSLADPGGIRPGPVELTPEEIEEFKARFEAVRIAPPKLLPGLGVTREQVRDAAHALFLWNNELAGEPRFVLHHVTGGVDREPYGALVDEVLHHLGITVQEGN